jgi:hypothetical protein
MIMAITPSLNASSLPFVISASQCGQDRALFPYQSGSSSSTAVNLIPGSESYTYYRTGAVDGQEYTRMLPGDGSFVQAGK